VSIINRRNAFLGWAVWGVSKRAAKMKAKGISAPAVEGRRPNKSLLAATAAGVAGVAGALAFWRKKRKTQEA
jgi:hypothetical protein